MATTKKSAKKPSRAPRPGDSFPKPPWLDSERLTERLIQRVAYPAYTHRETVRALAAKTSTGSVRARVDALFEHCVARGLLPEAWTTGGAPRCIGLCKSCKFAEVRPDGTLMFHAEACPETDRPRTLEFAVSLAAEACTLEPRGAVVDAEALAAEWMNALVVWGGRPFRGVYWTYEEQAPSILDGWDDSYCDLRDVVTLPAVAAARTVRSEPFLGCNQVTTTGYGALGRVPWLLEIFSSIERDVRAPKKRDRPRRAFDDTELEFLAFALEGASLWHAAITVDAVVTPATKSRADRIASPYSAVIGARFATLPNPWTALLALLATGAFPVGSADGMLALNLAR
ncbi:MAG: hypothetical protein JNK05_31980 [Myxococcales bacterium]|nr:hypothetical protein [Myxococcales bacterium]